MKIFSIRRYLRRFTIAMKFYIVMAFVGLILIFELASFGFALNTISSIRAYVGQQGLWARAQKASLDSLLRYTDTFDEAEYQNFVTQLKVPAGDNKARLELEKYVPNIAIAREGLIEGGNSPEDVDGMIFLFRTFKNSTFIKQTIQIWGRGDLLIQKQLSLGEQIHDIVSRRADGDDSVRAQIAPLLQAEHENDEQLTDVENQFAAALSQASRHITASLFFAILALTLVLGICSLLVATYIAHVLTQVDRAKSEFVALASHQLRAPLNVMSLSVELLQSTGGERSPEDTHAIQMISHEVWQMSSLIKTILDVSKMELGTFSSLPQKTDIVPIAQEEALVARAEAEKKGLTLDERYDASPLWIMIDPAVLHIILQNLLSNAIKYTKKGMVTMSISRTKARANVCVEDTGKGIPLAEQPFVFEKLYRGRNVAGKDTPGTGLGLYIVRSVVREAGGSVRLESVEGVGTKIFVSFPIAV